MVGLRFNVSMLNAWGMIDAERYKHNTEDQKESVLDVMLGRNGEKIRRELCAYGNKRSFNSCLSRYTTETRLKKARIEKGYVTHLVTQTEKDEGAVHAVVDSAAKYIEDEYDNILSEASLDELMHEFVLVRKHIMYEKNYDLALIMINAAEEVESADTDYAKKVLHGICEEYELQDFMQTLLTCNGAFDRIAAMI